MEKNEMRSEIKKEVKKRLVRFGIQFQVTSLALLPLVIVVAALTFLSILSMSKGMRNEVVNGLSDACQGVIAGYDILDPGEYHLEGEELYKGETNLSAEIETIDEFVKDSQTECTIFYEDTRYITSLLDKSTKERIIGTQASDAVVEAVLNKGEEYSSYDAVINGEKYFAYYKPIKDGEGNIVGMGFAGKPQAEVNEYIYNRARLVLMVAFLLLLAAVIVCSVVGRRLAKSIQEEESVLEALADGNLLVSPPKRLLDKSDEVGLIARKIEHLRQTLYEIVRDVREASETLSGTGDHLDSMAEQTDNTAREICQAVEDIASGATSQAEEIETATQQIGQIGDEIGSIADKARQLDNASNTMKEASDASGENVKALEESGQETAGAIESIEQQVYATNESAEQIKKAVAVIAEIASQTNLLSLNASIEAARAGALGKGFAVVASEISNLAAQSNDSSKEIDDIVNQLLANSEKSVQVVQKVREIIAVQEQKLSDTTRQFTKVEQGIAVSREESADICQRSNVCDQSKVAVVDVMSNLSALSQQNAASTQETMASMEELNATISMLADEAKTVSMQAKTLEEKISIFQI